LANVLNLIDILARDMVGRTVVAHWLGQFGFYPSLQIYENVDFTGL
jgi:hypothetical protein